MIGLRQQGLSVSTAVSKAKQSDSTRRDQLCRWIVRGGGSWNGTEAGDWPGGRDTEFAARAGVFGCLSEREASSGV